MINQLKDFKKVITELVDNRIAEQRGIDLYTVTGMGEVPLTVNIKRITQVESHDNVEIMGIGLGNGKGQIKLPNVNDVVLVMFIQNSETPIIIGTLFDIYSAEQDSKLDVLLNEYFVNNKENGGYIHIDNEDNVKIISHNGAKYRLNKDGSFKLFNKDNYGIECDASGNIILRGTTINHTQTPGDF